MSASGEDAIKAITSALERRGYHVVRSFDLQAARSRHAPEAHPPHGGQAAGAYQYVVLLVYPGRGTGPRSPLVLTAHSYGRTTVVAAHADQGAGREDWPGVTEAILEAGASTAKPAADEPEPRLQASV